MKINEKNLKRKIKVDEAKSENWGVEWGGWLRNVQ
jgi:hypothetical protein